MVAATRRQNCQRDLEIRVDQGQTRKFEEPDPVRVRIQTVLLQPPGDEAGQSDGGQEREGQCHAAELGQDTGRRGDRPPEQAVRFTGDQRVREKGSENRTGWL